MTTVVIVDDQKTLRDAVRKILQRRSDIQIVGEAENGAEALRSVETLKPDIVFLDIKMNDINGIEVTQQLMKSGYDGNVIILSQYDKEEYIRQAIEAGAVGYLLKESMTKDLGGAIETTRSGRSFFSKSISRSLVDECLELLTHSKPLMNRLT
jgi:DNA-binding NarL/FixJ family response regulator